MSGSLLDWRCGQYQQPRRNRRGRRETPYVLGLDGSFDSVEFMSPENLMIGYRHARSGGQAPGVDGLCFDDLSPTDTYTGLRTTSEALDSEEYRPQPHRLAKIPKGGGRFRELSIPTILDKAVGKSLDLCLRPFFENIYPDLHTSPWDIFAGLELQMQETGNMHLVEMDIKDCYPSLAIHDVLETVAEHIDDPSLLRVIEQMVRGHEGHGKTRGLSQGCPLSPLMADITLRRILRPVMEDRRGNPPFWRYVDNIVGLCRKANEGDRLLCTLQAPLAQHGLHLDRKSEANLRQRHRKPVKILGLSPIWADYGLVWKIPSDLWQEIDARTADCWNKPQPHETCTSLVKGLLNSLGPALTPATRPETVSRLMNLAARHSLRSPSRQSLLDTCQRAWQRWLDLRASVFSRADAPMPSPIGEKEEEDRGRRKETLPRAAAPPASPAEAADRDRPVGYYEASETADTPSAVS